MAEIHDRTESVFAAAVAMPVTAERNALLDRECANNPGLRGRIEALLRAHDQAGHLLDRPVPGGWDQTVIGMPSEQPGALIAGRYKLLEAIGEGGMGTVWVAEQTEPVRRKVALKLIKAGMDSRSVLARFEAERQALAVMDHPNIAKVLDGGLTETGRPFFVMEYVKGVPIAEYCDAARLSVPERLNLFVQVCHAVQHAHQKGIIHRDLKPSNILVAPYDDQPVPKVIDFGLAKAMHQSLTERTLHTAHETVLGTPLYMSPEQAQLNNLDVDTRSDIYSLGVLLYELLTGTTPLEKQRLKEAAWDEVRRIIREEEPPRPSLRLSSAQTLPSLAAGRQTEPMRLTKLVRGELDWIVMKSLEKDRARRYESASGFAADVQRYLDGEPVQAAPPSARYRLRKFARKHRAALSTAAAIAVMLVAGVAVSTWQAVRATRAETAARVAEQEALIAQRAEAERAEGERLAKLDAEAKQVEAELQKSRAETGEKLASERLVQVDAEKRKAEREKQIAQAVLDFLQNKLLRQADVRVQADTLLRTGGLDAVTEAKADPTIRELLDRAAQQLMPDKIDANFPKSAQAAILYTVGKTYLGVGQYDRAIGFLERSAALFRKQLGRDDSNTMTVLQSLAYACRSAEKLDLAVSVYEELFELNKAKFGPDDRNTLKWMAVLAHTYRSVGKLDLAIPLFEEALKLSEAKYGPDHRNTLVAMENLAGTHPKDLKTEPTLPRLEEIVKRLKERQGLTHPDTLVGMNILANAYMADKKENLAIPLYEETLQLQKEHLGPDHPDTLMTMNNLATSYQRAKLPDLAAALHEETLRLRKENLGADHSLTLMSLDRLAAAYQSARKFDQAIPLREEILKIRKEKFGHEHPDTLTAMNNLKGAYRAAGKLHLAVPHYEELVKHRKAKLGSDHPDTLASMWALATVYGGGSPNGGGVSFERAIPVYEEVWKIRKQNLPEGDTTRINSQAQLGLTLVLAGRFAEGEPHLLASFHDGTSAKDFPKDWPEAYALRLVCLYAEWGKGAEVSKWQIELNNLGGPTERWLSTTSVQMLEASRFRAAELLLQVQKAKLGPDHPDTLSAMWGLAGAYREGLRFDQAVPVIEELWRIHKKNLPEGDLTRIDTQNQLGLLLYFAGRFDEAEPHLLASYRDGMRAKDFPRPRPQNFARRLMCLYAEWGKTDEVAQWQAELNKVGGTSESQLASSGLANLEVSRFRAAELLLRDCLAIREKTRPDDWTTFDAKSMLGGALLGQKKYADAEPLLLAGYEGMKQREAHIPDQENVRLPEALDRLIELYAANDKPDEVKKWQAERAKYPPPVAPLGNVL